MLTFLKARATRPILTFKTLADVSEWTGACGSSTVGLGFFYMRSIFNTFNIFFWIRYTRISQWSTVHFWNRIEEEGERGCQRCEIERWVCAHIYLSSQMSAIFVHVNNAGICKASKQASKQAGGVWYRTFNLPNYSREELERGPVTHETNLMNQYIRWFETFSCLKLIYEPQQHGLMFGSSYLNHLDMRS
jgi:hypothetical protein